MKTQTDKYIEELETELDFHEKLRDSAESTEFYAEQQALCCIIKDRIWEILLTEDE